MIEWRWSVAATVGLRIARSSLTRMSSWVGLTFVGTRFKGKISFRQPFESPFVCGGDETNARAVEDSVCHGLEGCLWRLSEEVELDRLLLLLVLVLVLLSLDLDLLCLAHWLGLGGVTGCIRK